MKAMLEFLNQKSKTTMIKMLRALMFRVAVTKTACKLKKIEMAWKVPKSTCQRSKTLTEMKNASDRLLLHRTPEGRISVLKNISIEIAKSKKIKRKKMGW